jgi:16S rRNA (cytosine967-C5)-methyltransferase
VGKAANARAVSARILSKLLAGQGSLSSQLEKYTDHSDSPLIQEICYGVCRHMFILQAAVDQLLDRPLRSKDQDVYCLLLVGAYQIYLMRVPDHAAVNETVQATATLKKPWARGLVNSVLRRLIDRTQQWQELLDSDQEQIRYLHPGWLITSVRQDWPDHWQEILLANNQRAPMCLRVNGQKTTRDDYLRTLQQERLPASAGNLATTAVYLEKPVPVVQLPGFDAGLVSVQDEASQLVAPLLELAPGLAVLDACAAPGGKTCHILESEPSLTKLLALDIEPSRIEAIEDNLNRLGVKADVRVADAGQLEQWWDGTPFQRILLDAPCSATGVIRRHPDIKILRQPQQVESLVERQLMLLQNLWRCLAPGGMLLYTTCSVLKAENECTVERFLAGHKDAKHQAIVADWGLECAFGRQLLPDSKSNDGFYYARLQKC